MGIKQSSNHIFMIEPKTFFMNPETLASNHYQDGGDENPEHITAQAKDEFFALKNAFHATTTILDHPVAGYPKIGRIQFLPTC